MTQLALELDPDEYRPADPTPRPKRTRLRVIQGQVEIHWPDQRPRVYGQCAGMLERSGGVCPWLGCRAHLWNYRPRVAAWEAMLDAHPVAPPELWPDTCSLVVAERHHQEMDGADERARLRVIGAALGCSGERVRQIEAKAKAKAKDDGILFDLASDAGVLADVPASAIDWAGDDS